MVPITPGNYRFPALLGKTPNPFAWTVAAAPNPATVRNLRTVQNEMEVPKWLFGIARRNPNRTLRR